MARDATPPGSFVIPLNSLLAPSERMNHGQNNRHERVLRQLAEKFEANYRQGRQLFLNEEEYEDLLSYYFGAEEFDRALAVADQAIGQYRFTPEFYKWKALLHKINAQEEAAIQALDQLDIYAPEDFESLVLRLEILVHFDHRDAARATLDKLTPLAQTEQERGHLVFYDGILLIMDGQVHEAYTAFINAFRLDPWQEAPLAELLDNKVFRKYRKSNLAVLEELSDQDPFNDLVWFYRGLILAELGEEYEALEAFGYALALNDLRPDYLLEYADKLFDLEHYDRALAIYQRYLKRPDAEQSYETNMRMGRSHQLLGRIEEAKNCFLAALELEPKMYDIYQHLAECCAAQHRFGLALHYYERSVRCEGATADCWLGLAVCASATNEEERAEAAFQRALNIEGRRSDVCVTYALFLVEQGRERDALGLIETAREEYSDATLAYGTVAVYLHANRRKQALVHLAEALRDHYEDHEFLLEWRPDLRDDAEFKAVIAYYRPEQD